MSISREIMNKHRDNTNHNNYYYFTNAFTVDEINEIIKLGESYQKTVAVTGGGDQGTISDYRKSEVSWIPENDYSIWLYRKCWEYAEIANKEMWNFDIWGFPDDFQYTTYHGDGGHYDWHTDMGPGLSNRKLSMVLQLSAPEEYNGGNLDLNLGSGINSVPKGLGTLCFFPSFNLHRVTPLTSGTRRSLVTWLGGNNFR